MNIECERNAFFTSPLREEGARRRREGEGTLEKLQSFLGTEYPHPPMLRRDPFLSQRERKYKILALSLLIVLVLTMPSLAQAKNYTIKEISAPGSNKPYYFDPSTLTIQLGDTVTFVNAQDDMHNVMFDSVPKEADDMIMGPDQAKAGSKWSYTFTVPGTYHYHCHPHEALGMKGTLIVGHASAPGDTKNIDHDENMN